MPNRRQLQILLVCVASGAAGCSQQPGNDSRPVASPPGIAPADMTDAQSAGQSPVHPPPSTPAPANPALSAPAPSTPEQASPASNGGSESAAEPSPGGPANAPERRAERVIGRTTATVVDKPKALAANRNLIEVPNTVQGGDPVSLAASAYLNLRSRASVLGFENELKTFKALNDRNPAYAEFQEMLKQSRIEFAMLPPYQTYGYDATTGTLSILEDRLEKARRYKAAGIPLP